MPTPIYTPRGSHAGNRWWVGLQVAYGTGSGAIHSVPIGNGAPNGYESFGSGNATDDAKFAAAAAYNAANPSKPNTVVVQNISWFNVNGPYDSYPAAQAALPAIQQQNPAPGEFQQVTAGGLQNAANGGGINPNVFSSVANVLSSFYDQLTNYRMWRSLGWLLLGVLMIFVGLFMWIGSEGIKKSLPIPFPV